MTDADRRPPPRSRPGAEIAAVGAWLLLFALCLLWELWLAPLRPGGSWLALKAVPLLAPLRGLLGGRLRAFQAAILLSLLYFAEGAARLFESPPARLLAIAELALVVLFFGAATRVLRPSRAAAAARRRAAAA